MESYLAGGCIISAACDLTATSDVGTPLFTIVMLPTNLGSAKVGAVISRTPYNTSSLLPMAAYASFGWAVVIQDERGRFNSGGEYTLWRS